MLQPRLTAVHPVHPLMLRLEYETGEVKIFNVAPYATGSWYSQLMDQSYFSAVRLLPNGVGIEWPEGQDIAPHELYEESTSISYNPCTSVMRCLSKVDPVNYDCK